MERSQSSHLYVNEIQLDFSGIESYQRKCVDISKESLQDIEKVSIRGKYLMSFSTIQP